MSNFQPKRHHSTAGGTCAPAIREARKPSTKRQQRLSPRSDPAASKGSSADAPSNDNDAFLQKVFASEQLRWDNLDWTVVVWMVLMHAGALAAPFFFSWPGLVAAVVLHWLTGSFGICLGFHRYLSHRSLKLAWPAKAFVNLCGVLSGQGAPLTWAAVHRVHHARSDEPGDPHSPRDGKWWSHLLWLFVRRSREDEERLWQRYVPDLAADPMLRFFNRTYGLILVLSGVALYALGGLPMLLWGLCLRITLGYHCTWLVNSATHLWGYRTYSTRDDSKNNWLVALLAYGEGWHNNHHAHPRLARAGHRWWEIDPTFYMIRLFQWLGLARDVVDGRPPLPQTKPQAADASR